VLGLLNIFLFLSATFLLTFLIGRALEKIRVPWIFGALLLGAVLAIHNPFASVTSSETFAFLANLGMFFLLFVIGFEIDLKEMKKESFFIVKATFFIILLEAVIGSILIRFLFGYEWFISFLIGLSFATVGEAVLIPILDEFKIINSKLGQAIIGIGLFDDIIEIFLLVLIVVVVGSTQYSHFSIGVVLVSLLALFLLTVGFVKLKKEGKQFVFLNIETLFFLSLFVLFLFVGIGEYAKTTALAALLSGIALKTFIPKERLQLIESEIKTMCYGFFAPVFFLWIGIQMDLGYLASAPLLVLLIIIATTSAKILGSYIVSRKELKVKESALLGIGLSVRFSTSIIIIKILFDNGFIGKELFSVIVASSIVFTFVVPLLFSYLLSKWKIGKSH